jgi:hypothetical protein
MLRVGFEASEVIETFPLKLPEDCGAKIAVIDALCPGAKVKGVLNPEMLKPAPVAPACVMVSLVPPVLLSVLDWV